MIGYYLRASNPPQDEDKISYVYNKDGVEIPVGRLVTIDDFDIRDVKFDGLDLTGATIRIKYSREIDDPKSCDGASFRDAILDRATLQLRGSGLDFRGADLRGATLLGNFSTCDFRDADLRGADLRSARLFGCWLGGALLDGVRYGARTVTKLGALPYIEVWTNENTPSDAILLSQKISKTEMTGIDVEGAVFDNTLFSSMNNKKIKDFFNSSFYLKPESFSAKEIGLFNSEPKEIALCNFKNAVFRDCHFKNINFINCNFRGATFINCNLEKTVFSNMAKVDEVDAPSFINVSYDSETEAPSAFKIGTSSGFDFSESRLRAYLRSARFIDDIDFLYGADLRGYDLSDLNLSNLNLENTNLSGADLTGSDLRRARLSNAVMDGVIFDEHTDFEDAELPDSFNKIRPFRPDKTDIVSLERKAGKADPINLELGTGLISADLSNLDLSNLNLRGQDLRFCDFSNSNLDFADLRYADARWANFTGAKLDLALYDVLTKWPEGFVPPRRASVAYRSPGRLIGPIIKASKPDAPKTARDFKQAYPREFDMLKPITLGRDLSPGIIQSAADSNMTPFEWTITTMPYFDDYQRVTKTGNTCYLLNIDLEDTRIAPDELEILKKVLPFKESPIHPVEAYPLLTIGWVRVGIYHRKKIILVEEIQSDLFLIKWIKKWVMADIYKMGLTPDDLPYIKGIFKKYADRLYEDGLAFVFELAHKMGYSVEVMNFDTKANMAEEGLGKPPSFAYERLPANFGMSKRDTETGVKSIGRFSYYKPNPGR